MFNKIGSKLFAWLGEKPYGVENKSYLDKAYQEMTSFYKIRDLLPYESFDENTEIFLNSDSLGFVLETPPLVGASDEMQKEVSSLFQHVLPEESSLQVILYADPHIGSQLKEWRALRKGSVMNEIAERRAEHLNQFAFNSPNTPYCLRDFRCILSFSVSGSSNPNSKMEEVNRLKSQVKTTLEMLGLPTKVWKPVDLINTLGSMFNMNPKQTSKNDKKWNKLETLSEQISDLDSNLFLEEDGLLLQEGKIRVKTYQATQLPDVWSLHAMGQLIGDEARDVAQIPCPFILHYGIHIPKQGKPKAKVLTKATYVERQSESPIGKYLPSIQREADELRFVREQIGKGERIVQTEMNIILFAKTSKIHEAEQILMTLYHRHEWHLCANRFFHLPIFLSSLPLSWGEKCVKELLAHKKLRTTLSTESANLVPLQGEWKGTSTPGLLLSGRRGQIMKWYPFDNLSGNYNTCVIGRSGSGKSVFMQELMTSILGIGGKVFVMDVGRSFEKTCSLLEGQFVEFKAKTPLCLNPFSTIPIEDPEVTQDALAMLKPIIALMAAPTKGLDDIESALLEQAILQTWELYKQDSNITHIAEILCKHQNKKAQDLGTMLFPFTEQGSFGRFFNGRSSVDLYNPLVVVELEELKERKDLQAVVVQMMIINITNQMFLGDRRTPFAIIFDEAWDLLRGKQSAVFIETLARRLRKYYGSLVVGTQSVNDLFASPAAQAAFDNSDWMCLLSQKSESIEQLKKLGRISLTPLMETQLKSVRTKQGQYAEVMIYGSNGYAIGRLLLDTYSQLLYSTKADDYSRIQLLRQNGMSCHDALETLLTSEGKIHEKALA